MRRTARSIVAGPAIAIFGHILGNKGEEALNNAKSNLEQANTIEQESDLVINKLIAIQKVTVIANAALSKISSLLRRSTHELKEIINKEGNDFQKLSEEGKNTALKTLKFAQLIKAIIDTPILSEDGSLIAASEDVFLKLKAEIN